MMVKQISNKITCLCVEKNIVAPDKQDIYTYGMALVLSTIFSLTAIIGVAVAFNKLFEALIFIVFFAILRSVAGGYHSGSYLSCFLKFSTITSVGLLLTHFILNKIDVRHVILITATICILAITFVIFYAPVDTANKRFSEKEKILYREKSLKVVLFQGIILAMITYLDISLALAGSFGMLMQGMTLFPVLNK